MALVDTTRAIGESIELLASQISSRAGGVNVSVGRPEPLDGAVGPSGPRLNLFLYEAEIIPALRHTTVFEGQHPQLWLALRFLLTAFDEENRSDTIDSHRLLGSGLAALHEFSIIEFDGAASAIAALSDNPEPLRLVFLQATSDFLARVMQGSDEKYRFSMAFEMRPIMIAPEPESARMSLLVGVDYSATPEVIIGEDGVRIDVDPSMPARLTDVEPNAAAPGDTIVLLGTNLSDADVVANLGGMELPVVLGTTGIEVELLASEVTGDRISAGSQLVTLVEQIDPSHTRSSNPQTFTLLPIVAGASVVSLTVVDPSETPRRVHGTFDVTGVLLGGEEDANFVALYADGITAKYLVRVDTLAADQTSIRVTIPESSPVEEGTYRVVVQVNGAQARQSPSLELIGP